MGIKNLSVRMIGGVASLAVVLCFCCANSVLAQTDLNISGAKAGFPIAVPMLCNESSRSSAEREIPKVIAKNLKVSGIFTVLNPNSFVTNAGRCLAKDQIVYSDWSIIGAEALVYGKVRELRGRHREIEVILYLHDVLQKRPVLGKRYEGELGDLKMIADRFSNEIIKYFTGEKGVFGTKIAYVSKLGRFKEIFLMDTDGSNVKQLTRDRGLALSPSWNNDSSRIIYTSYRTRRPELYMISAEGGIPQQLTKRPGLELGAEFAPVGKEILASATVNGVTNLVMFDLRGRFKRKVTHSSAIDVSPSWSPDGRRIAFCSNRGGGPQIYVMNSDGSNPRRISFTDSNYCTSPAWSPKGDKIAYVCRDGANQVYISDTKGKRVIQLTFAGNNEDPAWSPDGRSLAFSSNMRRGGPRNVVVYSLLGNTTTQISYAKSEDSMPAWSSRIP